MSSTPRTKITFYGGIHEIGGNKFLVEDKGTRIFLDFGMQMSKVNQYFTEFVNPRTCNGMGDLFEFELLPPLYGLYRRDYAKHMGFGGEEETKFDAILITHAHVDHCAYIHYIRPEIPVYCSEATKLLMQAIQDIGANEDYIYFDECFQTYINKKGIKSRKKGAEKILRNVKVFNDYKPFQIDSIEIEPISVDHSIPGVSGFILHTSCGSIGYTADIRFHGRDELEVHYRHILESLGKEKGLIGVIFRKSQNKIQDPAKLRRLVDLINQEMWIGMDIDIKGDIYEGLLQKNAEDIKSGAGQYFTPRPLIKAIVEAVRPEPNQTVCDPACGTGGFLLASYDFISKNYSLDKEQKKNLKFNTLKGQDIVDAVARLCVMNLYLHGIGGYESPITVGDSLISDPGERYDFVLTNPPFGRKSSITVFNTVENGTAGKESLIYERQDFWATTSNKQLNFLQHVKTLLKINGEAAIVVPDNVLFEGGAGETVRRKLLNDYDVHTLLRLPTGVFYAQGVKANVLFFDKKPASEKPWTEKLWIYDLRTNKHITLKTNTLKYEDLQDFLNCYNPKNRHQRRETERFRSFTFDELIKRDKINLDIFWLRDESLEDSENLPEPQVMAQEIVENLESALEQFSEIGTELTTK